MSDENWYELFMGKPPSWQQLMKSLNSRQAVYEPVEYVATRDVAKILSIPPTGKVLIRLLGFHWAALDEDAGCEDNGKIIDGVWRKTGARVKFYDCYWKPVTHEREDVGPERMLFIHHP